MVFLSCMTFIKVRKPSGFTACRTRLGTILFVETWISIPSPNGKPYLKNADSHRFLVNSLRSTNCSSYLKNN
ncbi:hypothetical protein [African swine fever virus]|uniref:Uncharacterized protein n=1 Tax=African swine fever virus TaxID=10497 RepID=A0A3G1EV13_ASF|nr:hypothetical protein F8221_gp105 [African swine fever virus]AOO54410.1 hypothetical protein AFSV47Ss_0105 [African swine fever virus]QIM06746.1 hypothetical protein [African swine fever virus]QIM06981.1 hypothetical protein [African swine fever virus]QIM07216.1 hypothetical protein [African swine fever virus]QIM07451.1 hypothetical protein [African swine fever virus]